MAALSLACGHSNRTPKVIVLGVDGMDPAFVERHWDTLPNLRRLRDGGKFSRLGTTMPPQSPVAWSTFITVLPPSEHGIYDFVHRDPASLQPYSSLSRTEEPRFQLSLGPYRFPLSTPRVTSLRRGTPFWEQLSRQGIPVTVIRMPTNYPPASSGRALAGMGVPDLEGTLGTFSFYTDDSEEYSHSVTGGRIVKVNVADGRAILPVNGPPNTSRRDKSVASTNLTVDIDGEHQAARFAIGQDLVVLRQGEWSGWLAADFELIPHVSSVRGIFRVYAKQLYPRLALYISPINVDPLAPALPISYPAGWAREIALETNRYFTMGIPEDTAALRQGVLTHAEFRAQTRLVFEDEHRLFQSALRHFDRGLLFFYFSSIDQNSHILWGRYETELLEVYQAIDQCIGEVRRAVPDVELIVLSDHGFTSFDRAVHLNTWLRHRGFLATKEPPGTRTSLETAAWAETEAYAMGLNGLYLNMKGRERFGVIEAGARRRALLLNLREQLMAWRDPANGRQIIQVVEENAVPVQNAAVAPDLIVGYAPGYRASWQTALGGVPEAELEDNDDAWIGDHCIDPSAVPGVLFTSSGRMPAGPRLQDVPAFVLRLFAESSRL